MSSDTEHEGHERVHPHLLCADAAGCAGSAGSGCAYSTGGKSQAELALRVTRRLADLFH